MRRLLALGEPELGLLGCPLPVALKILGKNVQEFTGDGDELGDILILGMQEVARGPVWGHADAKI
ncbi:hypothetical protein BC938DRAFT_481199 [Jimgerdemannia flammicorona]|uniref:Uncharacterized protein n=1 Tax=Jimgerdemannia flammicorona TaxID=994334 RepID=A0A433QX51_9FUNG|nr:hypothetical protein BC938DRAFT_481199 [Jimgerdemannia flammicorona]